MQGATKKFSQSATGITRSDRSLLQSVADISKCDKNYTKCDSYYYDRDNYYKVRRGEVIISTNIGFYKTAYICYKHV